MSSFERIDDRERAYQRLEREYTNKARRGDSSGSGKAAGGNRKRSPEDVVRAERDRGGKGIGGTSKGGRGRWFD